MQLKYTDLSIVECNIFSIIPHGVGVEASFSLGRDLIGWRQSKTPGETLREKVVLRQFARGNNGILAGADLLLDNMNTENDLEMKKEAEERKFHIMAKVHNFLEMWQGCQNLHATQKEYCAQHKQMTALEYISDMEEIIKASWSLFQHDGAAAFKLSERSPLPPPLLFAKDLPGGRPQILNVHPIRRINCHPLTSDENSAPESISDTEDRLNWYGDLDNHNGSEDDCAADGGSDIGQDKSIEDPEWQEQRDVSAVSNGPGLIWLTQIPKRQPEKVLITVNAIERRRNTGVKKK